MTPLTRYSSTTAYVRAAVEHELAALQRRPSLVPADELARLGTETFPGADGDLLQAGFDALALRAAQAAAAGDQPDVRADVAADLELDRRLVDAGLPLELLRPLSGYAAAHAELIVRRERTTGNRATRTAAHYVGTWKPGTYERAAMTTHDGSLWHCEAERTTDSPGSSSAWKLMHKNHKKGAP